MQVYFLATAVLLVSLQASGCTRGAQHPGAHQGKEPPAPTISTVQAIEKQLSSLVNEKFLLDGDHSLTALPNLTEALSGPLKDEVTGSVLQTNEEKLNALVPIFVHSARQGVTLDITPHLTLQCIQLLDPKQQKNGLCSFRFGDILLFDAVQRQHADVLQAYQRQGFALSEVQALDRSFLIHEALQDEEWENAPAYAQQTKGPWPILTTLLEADPTLINRYWEPPSDAIDPTTQCPLDCLTADEDHSYPIHYLAQKGALSSPYKLPVYWLLMQQKDRFLRIIAKKELGKSPSDKKLERLLMALLKVDQEMRFNRQSTQPISAPWAAPGLLQQLAKDCDPVAKKKECRAYSRRIRRLGDRPVRLLTKQCGTRFANLSKHKEELSQLLVHYLRPLAGQYLLMQQQRKRSRHLPCELAVLINAYADDAMWQLSQQNFR